MFEPPRCNHRNIDCSLARQGRSEAHTDMCPRDAVEESIARYEEFRDKALEKARAAGTETSDEVLRWNLSIEKLQQKLARLYR